MFHLNVFLAHCAPVRSIIADKSIKSESRGWDSCYLSDTVYRSFRRRVLGITVFVFAFFRVFVYTFTERQCRIIYLQRQLCSPRKTLEGERFIHSTDLFNAVIYRDFTVYTILWIINLVRIVLFYLYMCFFCLTATYYNVIYNVFFYFFAASNFSAPRKIHDQIT